MLCCQRSRISNHAASCTALVSPSSPRCRLHVFQRLHRTLDQQAGHTDVPLRWIVFQQADLTPSIGSWGIHSPGSDCNLDAVSWYPSRSGVATRTEPFIAHARALVCGFLSYYHTLPSKCPSIDHRIEALISNPFILRQEGKTNLSHDGLNPAHVPC